MNQALQKLTRFLKHVLDYNPERIDLTLDEEGWADVETLLANANESGIPLNRDALQVVVGRNPDDWFEFDGDAERIRIRPDSDPESDSPDNPFRQRQATAAVRDDVKSFNRALIKVSRFLEHVLEEEPERLDLEVDEDGWANLDSLIESANATGIPLNHEAIEIVIDKSTNRVFEVDEDFSKIRVHRGVEERLGLEPERPPEELYHGTPESALDDVRQRGLVRGSDEHIQLRPDDVEARQETAAESPVLLRINAEQMFEDGFEFFRSDDDVWLTRHIPVEYVDIPES